MHNIILINIAGPEQPGLTSAITGILDECQADIMDIGQAVIHDTLSLGMLVSLPDDEQGSRALKDILFKTHEMGVAARFTPVSQKSYDVWVSGQGRPRFIVTTLSRTLGAKHLARISRIITDNNLIIDGINRLSGRMPLAPDARTPVNACIEFSVRGTPLDIDKMRADFLETANRLNVDVAFQEDNVYRRNRRLVAFDMDSTLIEAEVIDELAKHHGVGQQVAAITERTMRGELDFQASFRARVALLKGLDASVLQAVAKALPLTEGAERLVKTLKTLGYKTAILSGGFNYFGKHLQSRLGIDYVFANELEIVDGKVTGQVTGKIVDGNRKAALLKQLAETEHLNLKQVIAVGDGANDLPMLSIAGLGIAFRAKPVVRETAEQAISTLGLDGILYLIGVHDRDRDELLAQGGLLMS